MICQESRRMKRNFDGSRFVRESEIETVIYDFRSLRWKIQNFLRHFLFLDSFVPSNVINREQQDKEEIERITKQHTTHEKNEITIYVLSSTISTSRRNPYFFSISSYLEGMKQPKKEENLFHPSRSLSLLFNVSEGKIFCDYVSFI